MSIFDKKPPIPKFPATSHFFADEIIKKTKTDLTSELKVWNGYLKKELSTKEPHPLALRDIENEISNIKIFLEMANSDYLINRKVAQAVAESKIKIETIKTKNNEEVPLISVTKFELIESVKLKIKELDRTDPNYLEILTKRKVELRRLNSISRQSRGAIALHLNLVGGRNGHARCSKPEFKDRKQKNIESDNWIARTKIKGQSGEEFKLADSGMTKIKKLSEMYALLKGIDEIAEQDGLSWASVVCTLPSQMHPNPKYGKNSWDGTLPDEAWRNLGKNFALLRAGLAKKDIKLAGLKTAEAHQDGCPHVNFFIVFNQENKVEVEEAFNRDLCMNHF